MSSPSGSRSSTISSGAKGLGMSEPTCKECGDPAKPSGNDNMVDLCPYHSWLEGRQLSESELKLLGDQLGYDPKGVPPSGVAADKDKMPEGKEPSKGKKSVSFADEEERVPTPPPVTTGKVRMTPACADCKKAKKRCLHRQPIDEGNVAAAPSPKRKRGQDAPAGDHDKDVADSQNIVAAAVAEQVDVEAEAPPPAKRPRRVGRKPTTTQDSGVALKKPTRPRPVPTPVQEEQQQPRGSIVTRKRKLAEVNVEELKPEGTPQPRPDAAAAAGDDNGTSTVEESAPPPKRTRRATRTARAKANATASAAAAAAIKPVQSPPAAVRPVPKVVAAAEPANVTLPAPEQLALPPFPADSLEGSIQLAQHQVMSRELHRQIDDCRVKWTAAIEALESARRTMDSWLELWKRGL